MLGETYKKLGQFQEILKKCIIDRFGANLSQDKVDLLNNTNYVIESELVHFKTGTDIQGKILRDMLRSIIHIKCIKEFAQEDGSTTNIIYGEDIEKEIIEFYASNIADRYKFGIDSTNGRLSIAFELMDVFGPDFDKVMLSKNANEILSMNQAALFATNYNNSPTTSESVNITDYVTSTPVVEDEKKSILSEDEYKNLCMKFARNEALTPQEFNKLLMATPDLLDEEDKKNLSGNGLSEGTLEEQEIKSRGFALSSLSTYFVILAMLILMIFGFLVL